MSLLLSLLILSLTSWSLICHLCVQVASNSGRFTSWRVSDRLTLNWSGRHCLVWAGGRAMMRAVTRDSDTEEDIAVVMMNRAKSGQL